MPIMGVTSMIGTISDVLTRISAIEQQVQSLQGGSLLDSQPGISGGSSTSSSGSTSASDFANQLAAAQGDGTGVTAGASGSSFASLASSGLGSTTAGSLYSAAGATGVSGAASTGVSAAGSTGVSGAGSTGVSLSSSASGQLTSSQQQFASTLSADTGLNPNVVSAWLLAEESGGAAQSRQSAGNNDWLNIGYTDSATYGATDSVWSDPTTAANATASWLKGQNSIPGYGTASSGIQSILSTVGQTPEMQIQAIQGSGWSSGGYPSLGQLYQQVAGVSVA
jgi:hypothetical protein